MLACIAEQVRATVLYCTEVKVKLMSDVTTASELGTSVPQTVSLPNKARAPLRWEIFWTSCRGHLLIVVVAIDYSIKLD